MASACGRALARQGARLLAAQPQLCPAALEAAVPRVLAAWEGALTPAGARGFACSAAGAPAWGCSGAAATRLLPAAQLGATRGFRAAGAACDARAPGGGGGGGAADAADGWVTEGGAQPPPRERDLLAEVQGMSRKRQQCAPRHARCVHRLRKALAFESVAPPLPSRSAAPHAFAPAADS
jgi:hypothetical protein